MMRGDGITVQWGANVEGALLPITS
jgi:hypothetical protein